MVNLYHPLVRMIEMAIRLFNEQGIGLSQPTTVPGRFDESGHCGGAVLADQG
jgi:hypothetical protein